MLALATKSPRPPLQYQATPLSPVQSPLSYETFAGDYVA